jgi:putative ABC transport system permease protein
VHRDAPVYDIATLEQRLSESLAQRRPTMFLLSAFAGLAELLAAIGVYGVISYFALQRTREIGIRMALGAARGSVLRMILQQQARMVLPGNARYANRSVCNLARRVGELTLTQGGRFS